MRPNVELEVQNINHKDVVICFQVHGGHHWECISDEAFVVVAIKLKTNPQIESHDEVSIILPNENIDVFKSKVHLHRLVFAGLLFEDWQVLSERSGVEF